jgi:hypothetical protein
VSWRRGLLHWRRRNKNNIILCLALGKMFEFESMEINSWAVEEKMYVGLMLNVSSSSNLGRTK